MTQASADRQPATLVTGGAGFLGSHVLRELLTVNALANHRFVVLDDLSGGFEDNLPRDERVLFCRGSITDAAALAMITDRYAFQYIYHFAAYAAEGLSHHIRRFNYTNNVIGSVNLINFAVLNQIRCFVFTSSIAVYGAGSPPLREEADCTPMDPYGIAKYAVELDLRCAREQFGLESVIFRPHNIYGEGQNLGDRYRNVVGIFMNQILRHEPMTIFGTGDQQRAFSYVGDLASSIARAPFVQEAANRVFNIGADQPLSVNELAKQVANAMGCPDHPIIHLPPRKEAHVAFADHTAWRRVFGEQPDTPIAEGLAKMAAWAKRVGPRSSAPFDAIEIPRGLPKNWLGPAS